ncbi:MAG: M48 family metallopeptidase [Alphaproteobacteria bacterium]
MTAATPGVGRRTVIAGAGAAFVLWAIGKNAYGQSDIREVLHDRFLKNVSLNDLGQTQLGRGLETSFIASSGGRYLNPELQAAVTDFAQPLFLNANRHSFPWHVTVVDNDIPAAWSLPGGHVVIYKGLLRYLDSPDELAMAIAHVMAHAENADLTRSIADQEFAASLDDMTAQKLLRVVEADNNATILSGNILTALRSALNERVRTGYRLEYELAADQTAAEIMARSGYAASAGARMFEVIANLVPEGANGTTCLYGGKKTNLERVAMLARLPGKVAESAPSEAPFARIKSMFPTRRHTSHTNRIGAGS